MLLLPESVTAAEEQKPEKEVKKTFEGLVVQLDILRAEAGLNAEAYHGAYDLSGGEYIFLVLIFPSEEGSDRTVVGLELVELCFDEVHKPVYVKLAVLLSVLQIEVRLYDPYYLAGVGIYQIERTEFETVDSLEYKLRIQKSELAFFLVLKGDRRRISNKEMPFQRFEVAEYISLFLFLLRRESVLGDIDKHNKADQKDKIEDVEYIFLG